MLSTLRMYISTGAGPARQLRIQFVAERLLDVRPAPMAVVWSAAWNLRPAKCVCDISPGTTCMSDGGRNF